MGKVYVQLFDVTLGAHVGQYSLCVFSPTCGDALALEHTGDLYSCDHFVEPDFKLGNIRETHMADLVASARQRKFGDGQAGHAAEILPRVRRAVCLQRRCPKDRFIADARW